MPGQLSSDQINRCAMSQRYWLETSQSLIGKHHHPLQCFLCNMDSQQNPCNSRCAVAMTNVNAWLIQSSHGHSALRDALFSLLQQLRIGAHQRVPQCSGKKQRSPCRRPRAAPVGTMHGLQRARRLQCFSQIPSLHKHGWKGTGLCSSDFSTRFSAKTSLLQNSINADVLKCLSFSLPKSHHFHKNKIWNRLSLKTQPTKQHLVSIVVNLHP